MNQQNTKAPALSLRSVAVRRTFDFGFHRASDCDALQVSNGRLVEKKGRAVIFYNRINNVKA